VLSLAPNDEKSAIGKDLQMVGDRRLGEVKPRADPTAGELAGASDLAHHPNPALVCQCLQNANQSLIVHQSRD